MEPEEVVWLERFRAAFPAWWARARPLIAAHRYAAAWRDYPWPEFASTPWTPLTASVVRARLAVVTTAGLYRPEVDAPFDGGALEGDTSWRVLPRDVDIRALGIAHEHFNRDVARTDMNTVYPMERLRELEAAGAIGALAPRHYSLMGYAVRADAFVSETGPAIAGMMREDGVDAALIIPV